MSLIINLVSNFLGAVTELIARWLTQNLLTVDTLYGKASEDSDESMADADEEVAPEADQLSAGSSEEISIIQGIEIIPVLYFKN